MSSQAILLFPNPILSTLCQPVERFDSALAKLISDLTDTLYSTTGIGLSAPQIGALQRVLVMDLSDNQSDLSIFINPVVIRKAGVAIAEETCLSLPGVAAKILRSGVVQVSARDAEGNPFETELEGMHAICLQHELDHLNGKLFIDKLSRFRRFALRGVLKKLESSATPSPALQG